MKTWALVRNVLSAVIAVVWGSALAWNFGVSFEFARGIDTAILLILIPCFAMLGVCVYQLAWGIEHD